MYEEIAVVENLLEDKYMKEDDGGRDSVTYYTENIKYIEF